MDVRSEPAGPFSLEHQRQFFGDWLSSASDPGAIVMAFPIEGWNGSAAAAVRQAPDGSITGTVSTTPGADAERAWEQVRATLSLDVDGTGFPEIGVRDPVLGALATRYDWLRPVCFYSPYEAAVNFVIGQRISMRQARALRARLSRELGDEIAIEEQVVQAFPLPERLAALRAFPGLPDEKVARMRGIAAAAADGQLDRAVLRALPVPEALARLQLLRGVGPFAAQGILHRGAGLVDDVPDDEVTKEAVMLAYALPRRPPLADVLSIAEAWRPFRMWATVLLHLWLRRERGGPSRTSNRSRAGRQQATAQSAI